MPSSLALAGLVVVLAGLVLVPWLSAPIQLTNVVPFEKPPAVLEDRARELVRRLGLPETPADHATGFSVDADYLQHVRTERPLARAVGGSAHGHAAGPAVLVPPEPAAPVLALALRPGVLDQPAADAVGDGVAQARYPRPSGVVLRGATPGRARRRPVRGPRVPHPAAYAALFEAAGLDRAAFRPVPSRWTPPFFADHRAAFEGSLAERPDLKVRIEAASWRGRPVAFYPVADVDAAGTGRAVPGSRPRSRRAASCSRSSSSSLFVTALLLARHHLRTGRADRAGSMRLALGTLLLGAASWAAGAHHLGLRNEEIGLFILGIGAALFLSLVLWLFYVALEPFVRRLWPHALISWTRLLANGPRDPLVARDLLAGMAVGTVIALVSGRGVAAPGLLGRAAEPQWTDGLDALLGVRYGLDLLFTVPLAAAGLATGTFLLLVLLRLVLKRELLAAAVLVVVVGTISALRWDLPLAWAAAPLDARDGRVHVRGPALRPAGLRGGGHGGGPVAAQPLSTDLSSFRGEPTLLVSAVILAVAVFAFRQVRRGRSVRRREIRPRPSAVPAGPPPPRSWPACSRASPAA